MERIYRQDDPALPDQLELHRQTAFHEAGHAAAIYYGNRQHNLPPVFFEIQIKRPEQNNGRFYAKVVDGHLIQNLPVAIAGSVSELNEHDRQGFKCALEADVMNLLVGPLAEAKYVAERDDEIFNANMINIEGLRNYGGCSDVDIACEYLRLYISVQEKREEKLRQLLARAYRFIQSPVHWRAVKRLAQSILDNAPETMSCDEVIALFEERS